MRRLVLDPDSGLRAQRAASSYSASLDGPAGTYGALPAAQAWQVDARWTCDPQEYNYLTAFWRGATDRGASPFLINLPLDEGMPVSCIAWFAPGSVRLSSVKGDMRVLQASLLAIPEARLDYGAEADAARVALLP